MRYIFIEGCLVQIVHIYFVDLIVVLYSLEENYLNTSLHLLLLMILFSTRLIFRA